jgi:hypothetical protein
VRSESATVVCGKLADTLTEHPVIPGLDELEDLGVRTLIANCAIAAPSCLGGYLLV